MAWRQEAGRVSCKVCRTDLSNCLLIRVLPETHRIPSSAIIRPHAETQWVAMLEKKPRGIHRMIRKAKSTAPGALSRKMFPLLTLLTSRDTFRCENPTHPARKYRNLYVSVKFEARLLITHVPGCLHKRMKRRAGYFSTRLKGRAAVRQSKFRANLLPGIGEAGCHWQTNSGLTGFLGRVETLGRRQMGGTFQPYWTVSSVSRVILGRYW